ncbi:ring finger protein 115, partial [Chrysochromulina tobinii]
MEPPNGGDGAPPPTEGASGALPTTTRQAYIQYGRSLAATAGERHDRRRTRRFALSFSSSLPERSTVIDGIAAALCPGSSDGLARLLEATTAGLMSGGASPADARALATLERVEEPDATATCAICLDDLNCLEAAPVARLPRCSHAFHEACLLPWLRDCRGTCPICRTPLAEPTPPPAHAEPPIGPGPLAAGQLAGGISRATDRPTAPSHTDEVDHMSEVRTLMGAAYHFAGANATAATADRPALARQRAALAAHYERHLARRSEREALLRERADEIFERERRLEQAADSIREAASSRTADAFDDAMAAAGL